MDPSEFLNPEIQGELEMIEAMYSDQVTISHTEFENLHRLDSSESGFYLSPTSTTEKLQHQQDGRFPHTNTNDMMNVEDFHTVVFLRLRKRVEIELSFPSSGYYINNNSKIKLRIDVVRTPNCIDTENLYQAMKEVVKEHNIGEGALIITVCQAAEQHVEGVLANVGGSSSEEEAQNDQEDADGDDNNNTSETMFKKNSSAMMTTTDSTSNTGVVHFEGSEAAIWQELSVQRKCIRGSNPISDRRSKFLAHAAPISSEKEAMEIVTLLRDMKSIACACHPSIWAYRFSNPQTKMLHYDCDDDGEKNGAKNILFVMEQLKVDGWIVIVTRYFGGILLQGDRFRHIASVTRSVIEEAGAANGGGSSASTTKK